MKGEHKMKIKKIVTAWDALARLTEKRFTDYKKVRAIVKLRQAVDAEFEIYAAEEKKAVDTYAELNGNGTPAFLPDGRLKLKDEKAKVAFESEIAALLDSEVDSIEPIQITEKDFRSTDDLPTPDDMIALDGLVDFVD